MTKQKKEEDYDFATLAVHGGYFDVEEHSRSRVPPLYQTTSFTFKDDKHAARLFALEEPGNIYTRIMNPTTAIFEQRIAQLEGGIGALAVASGQSAETITFMTLAGQGDEIVSSSEIYGGSYTLLNYTLRKLGISTTFLPLDDPAVFAEHITEKTKMLYLETLPNPKLTMPDLEEFAKIAHENDLPLVVDNTVPSPYLLNPIKWGADIVVHSTTKYISGHGYTIGGMIVDSGNFAWEDSPRFPDFREPEEAYHGLKFSETFGSFAFLAKARTLLLRDLGAALSPFNAWLGLIGVETLPLRMEKISKNAQQVAEFLANHDKVAWVNYPGLKQGEDGALYQKYMPKGYSGLLGFGLKGGYDAAVKVINSVQLFSHLANIGDVRSLIIHPASTTHQQLSPEEQEAAGISQEFIRLSLGIEDPNDLIEDLKQAFDQL